MARERLPDGLQKAPAGVATAKGASTEVELSRAQQATARRAAESKATIPHLAVEADIDMHECMALRERWVAASEDVPSLDAPATTSVPGARPGGELVLEILSAVPVPTYEDMVIKACALALREHPRANSSYRDGRLQLHARVNVGLALWVDSDSPSGVPVGAADGGTLITPTVFDADIKPLEEIARETRLLGERARADALEPPELSGATFTIASLGMFPMRSFTAVINPPQAAILAVGAVGLRPVAHAGAIVARHTMTATLACDARALHGADAARLLARIEQLLQEPAGLAH